MSGKNKMYLALDSTIATAFLLSLATGFAWLLSEGGRSGLAPLGIVRSTWSDLHTWFSLVMIAGAIVHLALHWEWVVSLTRRLREGKAKKARWNYVFDGVLGLTLVIATVTGLVFLAAGGGGYEGGRNPAYNAAIGGLDRGVWSDLHTWFGLGFLAVLVLHQALHWAWIRNTIGRVGQPARPQSAGLRPREVAVRTGEQ
jgi:uncharacterized membrane protein